MKNFNLFTLSLVTVSASFGTFSESMAAQAVISPKLGATRSSLIVQPPIEKKKSESAEKPWSLAIEIGHDYQLVKPKPLEPEKPASAVPNSTTADYTPPAADSTGSPSSDGSSAEKPDLVYPRRAEDNYIALKGSYKFKNSVSLVVDGGYAQDLLDSDKSSFADTQVFLRKKFTPESGTADYSLQFANSFPTSNDSIENTSHLYGMGLSGKIFSKPGTVLWGWVDLEASLGFTRNFHEFKTSVQDKANSEYAANQRAKATLKIANLSFSVELLHRFLWDYESKQTTRYGHIEVIDYQINKTFSMSLSHDVGSQKGIPVTKAADGSGNIGLINDDASSICVALAMSI